MNPLGTYSKTLSFALVADQEPHERDKHYVYDDNLICCLKKYNKYRIAAFLYFDQITFFVYKKAKIDDS